MWKATVLTWSEKITKEFNFESSKRRKSQLGPSRIVAADHYGTLKFEHSWYCTHAGESLVTSSESKLWLEIKMHKCLRTFCLALLCDAQWTMVVSKNKVIILREGLTLSSFILCIFTQCQCHFDCCKVWPLTFWTLLKFFAEVSLTKTNTL